MVRVVCRVEGLDLRFGLCEALHDSIEFFGSYDDHVSFSVR
jgi:hypothetical protein